MPRVDRLNRSRYWRDPRTPGLALMRADVRTQTFAPHRHESVVIAVTELGGSVMECRGRAGEVHPRTVSVFNPYEAHAGRMGTSRHWRYRSLYLEQEALDQVAGSLGLAAVPYFGQTFVQDDDLVVALIALHRAFEAGRDALRERELLVMTFGALFERHGSGRPRIEPGPRDRTRLGVAVDLMHARLAGRLTLAELGDEVGLTEYQLTDLFKRTVGMTPHAYLTQLRLDRARRLLGAGTTISETALVCGFYDQPALTRYFKTRYGMTPLQFVQACRGQAAAT